MQKSNSFGVSHCVNLGFSFVHSKTQFITAILHFTEGFSGGSAVKNTCQCRRCGFDPWIRKIPWKRTWQSIPVFLPGKSYGQRSLADFTVRGALTLRTEETKILKGLVT